MKFIFFPQTLFSKMTHLKKTKNRNWASSEQSLLTSLLHLYVWIYTLTAFLKITGIKHYSLKHTFVHQKSLLLFILFCNHPTITLFVEELSTLRFFCFFNLFLLLFSLTWFTTTPSEPSTLLLGAQLLE